MDLYNIICPYCQAVHHPRDYDEGYQAVVCFGCNKPFVNQTTMTPVFHSFALVGFDSPKVHDVDEYYRDDIPTQEEIEEDAKYYAEHPEELAVDPEPLPEYQPVPDSPNTVYRLDGDYVDVKYKKSTPVKTTWADIHMLCEEEKPTPLIVELLGEEANTNKVAAVNAFVRAVKAGKVEG